MLATKTALILAGSTLRTVAGTLPKPLVHLNGKLLLEHPLLEHVLLGSSAGITRLVILVGYRGDTMQSWVSDRRVQGIGVDFVEKRDYNKANGLSLLKARILLTEPFAAEQGSRWHR